MRWMAPGASEASPTATPILDRPLPRKPLPNPITQLPGQIEFRDAKMPLVRISHVEGKPPKFAMALSQGVHRAMVETFNVPADDYFQIVTGHAAASGVIGPTSFLGIEHTPDLIMVQITCAEGRTIQQKKALYLSLIHI